MPDDAPAPDDSTGLGCFLVVVWGAFGCGFYVGLQLAISVYQGHW